MIERENYYGQREFESDSKSQPCEATDQKMSLRTLGHMEANDKRLDHFWEHKGEHKISEEGLFLFYGN